MAAVRSEAANARTSRPSCRAARATCKTSSRRSTRMVRSVRRIVVSPDFGQIRMPLCANATNAGVQGGAWSATPASTGGKDSHHDVAGKLAGRGTLCAKWMVTSLNTGKGNVLFICGNPARNEKQPTQSTTGQLQSVVKSSAPPTPA